MNTIETGYMIGGRTWISDKWNAGTLTREDVHNAIAEFSPKNKTEEELRKELRESESECAQEEFEEEGNTTPYDTLLEEHVERELNSIVAEQNGQCDVAEALQDLYEFWTDRDDEDQFDRVCVAHHALDDYCRKLQYGEFGW